MLQQMTLTAHEVAEWNRAADALERRGAMLEASILRVYSRATYLFPRAYDEGAEVYRAWLVFDEPKSGSERAS